MTKRHRAIALALLAAATLAACEQQSPESERQQRIKTLYHLNKFEQDFGYTQAVRVADTIYVSGSVAHSPRWTPDLIASSKKRFTRPTWMRF